jgi:flagellar motility protein MotE (MotC chaperone)
MAGKLKLIILAIAALGSMGGSFFLATLTAPAPPEQATTDGTDRTEPENPLITAVDGPSLREREIEQLIGELKAELDAQKQQRAGLEQQARRQQMTLRELERESQELDNQRLAMAGRIAQLKEEQDRQRNSRIVMKRQEAERLKSVAAIYEKMDSVECSGILTAMCSNAQIDDAVKILSLMSDRPAAKVLAEVADKDLAAQLVERMKRLQQEG